MTALESWRGEGLGGGWSGAGEGLSGGWSGAGAVLIMVVSKLWLRKVLGSTESRCTWPRHWVV
jgi:hypothetical protein